MSELHKEFRAAYDDRDYMPGTYPFPVVEADSE
jgi:hypothetical protein